MRPDNPYHRSSDRRGAAVAPKIEARIERNKRRFRCPNTGREVNGVSTHGETRLIRIRAQWPICGDIHEWQIVDEDFRIVAADRHSKDARLTQAQSAHPGFQRRNTETIKLREQLLDEFSYRLKNNQEMLLTLLQAASRKTENSEARELLSDTSRRIGAMGAAQQVFYSAGNSTDVSGQKFLEAVCANARAFSSKEIAINCEVAKGSLPKETMTPLALVLNELLTNAAKHAINAHGRVAIIVGLNQHSGLQELYVQDSGPGFTFTSAQGSSGLGLVTMLARRLRGTFTVERRSGARCTLRIPDQ